MTEAEWLAATDPFALIGHLRGSVLSRFARRLPWSRPSALPLTPRKIRLVFLTWSNSVLEGVPHQLRAGCKALAAEAEVFADLSAEASGRMDRAYQFLEARLNHHWAEVSPNPDPDDPNDRPFGEWNDLMNTAVAADATDGVLTAWLLARELPPTLAAQVRSLFGNPFRPVAFSPSWLTSPALSLARSMYDTRDFSAMPILADALQDAGCEDADVLAHCRGAGPHVRGCWVVDLVLGKA